MVGQNIGKYRVLDRVGRGGMGTVYRAIDETLHREVAIKVLNAELNDPEVARRFRAEAITVARLSHPGIATIYELFQHESQWLMVMEFVRGETLERLIEREGPQTPDRAAELCMHSLAALAHAHSMGVVHRDLKPANIMLTENGVIKIMDFGIARVSGTEHLTNAGFMMGTPAYMAPEQVLGHEIDARADLYAMGVVFYRLLTGQLPFKGETPFAMAQAQVNATPIPVEDVRTDLPAWVEPVVTKSLAKKPEERFQSAVEFHEHFSSCVSVEHPPATPRTGLSRAVPVASQGTATSAASGSTSPAAAGTPSAQPRTPSGAFDPSVAQTVLSPSGSQQILSPSGAQAVIASSGAQSSDLFGSPGPATSSAPTMAQGGGGSMASGEYQTAGGPAFSPAGAESQPTAQAGSKNLLMIAAGIVALLGIGGAIFFTTRQPATPPVAQAETTPEPDIQLVAEVQPEPEPPPPPVAPVAPAPTSPEATADGGPDGATAGAGIGAAAGTATGATPGATPGARGAAGAAAAPPVDDQLLAVKDVRVLVIKGKKADDQEVLLNFGNGRITILNAKSGTPIADMAYRAVAGATYIRARDPRWNPELASPPDDLDVGGMLRTSKHYLALQGKDQFQILRLEDSNVVRVLQAVEARTGITIDRPRSGDRN